MRCKETPPARTHLALHRSLAGTATRCTLCDSSRAAAAMRQQQGAHSGAEGGWVVLVVFRAPRLAFDEHGQQVVAGGHKSDKPGLCCALLQLNAAGFHIEHRQVRQAQRSCISAGKGHRAACNLHRFGPSSCTAATGAGTPRSNFASFAATSGRSQSNRMLKLRSSSLLGDNGSMPAAAIMDTNAAQQASTACSTVKAACSLPL